MLDCCSDTLSVTVSLGMYQLPIVGVDIILVCKPFKLVNGHLSTRLETRTKESNIRASSWVVKPFCATKVTAGMLAPATDQSIERGLSMSTSVRTRKMVNYACVG